MNFSAFTTRHWISVGLCIGGFAVPIISFLYLVLRFPKSTDQLQWLLFFSYQWLPVTALLWLAAAYVFPDERWHLLAWIVLGLSALVSIVFYLLMLGYSHS